MFKDQVMGRMCPAFGVGYLVCLKHGLSLSALARAPGTSQNLLRWPLFFSLGKYGRFPNRLSE